MLEQLAYISEIVGMVVVIVSLIYVGRQLKQNTEALQINAAGSWVGLTEKLCGDIATDRNVAELWTKAGSPSDFDSMDTVDQQRAIAFEWRAITHWNQWYQLRRQGIMPDAQWNEMIWLIQNFSARRSVIEAWNQFKDGYDESFREFVSIHIEEGNQKRATA